MTKATCYIAAILIVLSLPVTSQAELVYRMATDATAFWDFDGPSPLNSKATGTFGLPLTDPGGTSSPTLVTNVASGNGWTADGLSTGNAASFDSGDYYAIPAIYSGGDFTFFSAVNDTVLGGGHDTILASSRFRYQSINELVGGAGVNAPGGSFGTGVPITVGDWYGVALVYDDSAPGAGTLSTYVVTNTGVFPGVPQALGSATAPGLGNATGFRYGGDGTSGIGGFDGFAGEMDFLVFDNTAMSPSELQELFDDFLLGPQGIPEPSSLLPLGLGALGLMRHARRRRRRA